MSCSRLAFVILLVGASLLPPAVASEVANVIVPQRRVLSVAEQPAIRIERVAVDVAIEDLHATTTLRIHVHNSGARAEEAEVLIPVPPDAAVTHLHYDALGPEPTARILPRAEARRIYESIVSRMRDPALLEFAGSAMLRTSAFPVPAGRTQIIEVGYEQILARHGERCDYLLPRSQAPDAAVPWTVRVELQDRHGIGAVFSPTHEVVIEDRPGGGKRLLLAEDAAAPGALRLSWLSARAPVPATVAMHPGDGASASGWFLATVLAPEAPAAPPRARSLTVVIDRSGSMGDGKLAAVVTAVEGLLAGLGPEETVQLIAYHHGVERFATAPVVASAEHRAAATAWLRALEPRGGTNIEAALGEALRQPVSDGRLPVVLFLTDGLPTVGETVPARLRAQARARNPGDRRLFTIGVGTEIDGHLLEGLALDARATATFITPGHDIVQDLALLFERLHGPVLTDLAVTQHDAAGRPVPGRVVDVEPAAPRDLFAGDRLLIAGRYLGREASTLRITGTRAGAAHVIELTLDPAAASYANDHVPRMWAARRIATLVDAVRELGADGTPVTSDDPRHRELVTEILRLSAEHGILTEYTAFLAEEPGGGVAPPPRPRPARELAAERLSAAATERDGSAAVAQSVNNQRRRDAQTVAAHDELLAADLTGRPRAPIANAGDRAAYRYQGRWVDGRLLASERANAEPDRVVDFGSTAYFDLVEALVASHRQGLLAQRGDLLLEVDGEVVLVRGG